MSYIKLYKELFSKDVLDMLYNAYDNKHLMYEPNIQLSDLIIEKVQISTECGDQYTEDDLYDYIRFELDVSTIEDVRSHTDGLQEASHDDVEDFLSYHTYYLGSYTVNDVIYYVYTAF